MRRVDSSELEVVYGDKGYISRRNVQFIHELGAYPAIEPKSGLRGRSRGHRAYKQLVREYQENPEEWKEKYQYGRRSRVETVFSMLKVRFGGGLRSRRPKEQKRELLFKVILHNIGRLNFLECAGRWIFLQSRLLHRELKQQTTFWTAIYKKPQLNIRAK